MRTTTGRALSLLLCATLLAGCGDDEPSPEGAPSDSPSGASSTPSESSEPEVEPASGPRVKVGGLSMNLPRGFEPREAAVMGSEIITSSGPDGERLALVSAESFNVQTVEEAISIAVETGNWVRKPKRLEDVYVDNVKMFRISGPSGIGYTEDEFGVEYGGYDVNLTIASQGSKAERQELIDSILASVTWD